ncbi:MAG TPA: hypothetical protein VMV10_31705 [Pirellulales bacterium]|nr:hypothetical protein [Pirellulales bacterium]
MKRLLLAAAILLFASSAFAQRIDGKVHWRQNNSWTSNTSYSPYGNNSYGYGPNGGWTSNTSYSPYGSNSYGYGSPGGYGGYGSPYYANPYYGGYGFGYGGGY